MLIISLFSFVVPSLIKHSYKEKESVQTTIGMWATRSQVVTIWSVDEIAIAISIPAVIAYSSEARTARVTLLYFIELQWIRFPASSKLPLLGDSFPRTITQPIYKLKSALLAKEPSTKMQSFALVKSNSTNRRPRSIFSICHFKRLFSSLIYSGLGFLCYAAAKQSNAASS